MTRPAAPSLPLQADEKTTLVAFLQFFRAALLDRAYGLDDAALRVASTSSTLSLARLIGHMTMVEYTWFAYRFEGADAPEPWNSLDWDADVDAEMTRAEGLTRDELLAEFTTATADADRCIDAAPSLDALSDAANADGERWSMRWILVHMIEEYARHVGHADLIREGIDGDTAS